MDSATSNSYNHYINNEHERTIHLYENSNKKTAREIHEHFQQEGTIVPINTIHSWIERYQTTKQINNKPKGGNKRKNILTSETQEKIHQLQLDDNEYTLNQIQENLPEPKPSLSTIWKVLHKKNFTTKQLHTHVDEKNSDVTKAKRIEFAEHTQDYLHEANTIFIDETPWNLGMKRKRGRSLKGKKAIKKQRVLKGNNISLIAAISIKNKHYQRTVLDRYVQKL
jgi:transposase